MFKKLATLKKSVVDTVSDTVDEVKTKMANAEEEEMVLRLRKKFKETGKCPCCCKEARLDDAE